MISLLKKCLWWGYAISFTIIGLIPDTLINNTKWLNDKLTQYGISNEFHELVIKFLFLGVCLTLSVCVALYIFFRFKKRKIKIGSYIIELYYGDIFKAYSNALKVIPFDECFTLEIGTASHQIKPTSLCGQYLIKYPPDNDLIQKISAATQANKISQYRDTLCAESGTIIERDNFILLAFAKLDDKGKAHLTNREYIETLMNLWANIDGYSSQYDICVPILGSNITRFDNGELTKQQLLNIMIQTYLLEPYKIKSPSKLIIICKRSRSFSIWNFKY